jgi:phosphate:Na+ symporter
MAIAEFLLELVGAIILILFAIRMVRTAVERAFGTTFRRLVTGSNARLRATFAGMALAAIMQSSLAVAILITGFVNAGTLSFQLGLPAMLGADLGSALVIQFLSVKIGWLAPLLLVSGGLMFLKSKRSTPKQIGRALLGIALILIALDSMRATVMPIRDSTFLLQISALMSRDFITAFLVGTFLTFIMHSSLAVVLMIVTLVSLDALPLMVGISLMLGANLGSSLLPLWITRAMPPLARQVPMMNFLIRGTASVIMVVAVNQSPLIELLPDLDDAQKVILSHILFNTLLLLTVPLSGSLELVSTKLIPQKSASLDDPPAHYRSVLNHELLDNMDVATASIRREVQRMLLLTEEMMLPIMDLFQKYDSTRMKKIVRKDLIINEALNGTRRYRSRIIWHKWCSKCFQCPTQGAK